MKVFIHYQPRNPADAFEGTRLRKTLKGACEAVDIAWVDSPQDEVSVAHFLSPLDLPLLKEAKANGIPTVVSAFYAEDDPSASFLSPKGALPKKVLEFLNAADLVLVPDARMNELAKNSGVTTKVAILEPAVRMNRFSDTASEKKIFPRYFGIKPEVKTVVSTGSYGDKKTINLIKNVAKACPSLEFYFFGARIKGDKLNLGKKAARLHRPSNIHFKDIVQDDVYRSALMNSIAYISNDAVRPDPLVPLEAFASKTQVVGFRSESHSPLLLERESCYFFQTAEEMAAYLASLNSGEAESTINKAYAIAKAHNLVSYGQQLKSYYEALASGEQQ